MEAAYNFACKLTKQVLLGKISANNARAVFEESQALIVMSVKNAQVLKAAFEILLAEFKMSKLSDEIIPSISLPKPANLCGVSVPTIDSSFARVTVLRRARFSLL